MATLPSLLDRPDAPAEQANGAVAAFFARIRRPERLAVLLCLVALLGIVLFPLVTMVVASFRPADTLPYAHGAFTFSSVHSALSSLIGGGVLANSVIYSASTLAVGLIVAIPLAYLSERTDFRWRELLYVMMFISISIPGFAYALGWLLLANPNSGFLNDLIHLVFGGRNNAGPLTIYNMGGLVFIGGLGIVPSIWLVMVSLLRNYDAVYDQAARTSGAGVLRTFRRVTLPLLRPGIGAVVILFFMVGLQALEIPIALGPAAHVQLLPVAIYQHVQATTGGLPDYAVAASFGLFSLALGLVLILCYFRLLRNAESYVTVRGRGMQPELVRLGRKRFIAYGLVALYALFGSVAPMAVIVYSSLLKYFTTPGNGTLSWTWSNYSILSSYGSFWQFFVNTVIVAAGSAVLTGILGIVISWAKLRHPSPVATTASVFSFLPLAIPGTIVSLALFVATVGTPLFESLIVMVVAETAAFLPYSVRLAQAAQLQVSAELEEAARTSGGGPVRAFGRINFPLIRPAFTNSFLWVFIHASKDFSVGLILASSSTALVANLIYNSYEGGDYPQAAAMMVVLIGFNVIVLLFARRRLARTTINAGVA